MMQGTTSGRLMTDKEFFASLDEACICGERVKKITEHPAFRNSARMLTRLYDALCVRLQRKSNVPRWGMDGKGRGGRG
jgi:aromatic ring hydroxylase